VYEAGAKEVALSVVSGINCKYDGRISFNTLPIIEDISPTFAFSSKYLCLWANKQWKNIHDDGNY
jgi:hypothetical protein